MALITTPNIPNPDDFFAALTDLHRDLSESESQAVNAKLILLLANHVGHNQILEEALTLAVKK
ncbi:MAG: DUF2783 domain-containing protein [Porticoccaceae bacterium]